MDLNILTDKDYSLLVNKYPSIKQLTKNVGEIINFLSNSTKVVNTFEGRETYLIDIETRNLKDILLNIKCKDKSYKSEIDNVYIQSLEKIKDILLNKSINIKIIFVENPILVLSKPLFSLDNSQALNNVFIDHDYIDTWSLFKKRFVDNQNITTINFAEIIDPIDRSDLINYFRTDSYLNYKNIGLIRNEIINTLDLMNAKPYKVFVLDLDNTLWHGILREVGYENLVVGGVSTFGKFFYEFQSLLKWLKEKGILLTIVSKNNREDVMSAFKYLDPPLLLDDFVKIKTNDKPKSFNIKDISDELNLSLDDFIFIDDTLHERAEVLNALPAIAVPNLKTNQFGWFKIFLEDSRFKKTILISSRKGKSNRTDIYKKREERIALKPVENEEDAYNNWLISLNQKISAHHTKKPSKRGYELFERVNQFNSLSRKLSGDDIDLMVSKGYEVIEFAVEDKFSNDGIVAVVLLDKTNKTLSIHDFLMSCRVFGRKIEFAIIEYIYRYAQSFSCNDLKINFKVTDSNKSSTDFLSSITINNKFDLDLLDIDQKLTIKK